MDTKEILNNLSIKPKETTENKYIGSIYVLYNSINNKIYIGQTIQPIYKRFIRHKSNANLGCPGHLYNAIRKYGWDKFKTFVIYQTEEVDSRDLILEELNNKEIYYIKYFNSSNNQFGYNITSGGSGKTGTLNNSSSIPILQFEIDGTFIKEWPSMHEIERVLGFSHKSISYFNYGASRKSSYKGFLWIKKSEYFEGIFDDYAVITKKVACYDLDGHFLNSFDSMAEAARFYNINKSQISSSCTCRILTAGEFIFLYQEDDIKDRLNLLNSNKTASIRAKNKQLLKEKKILQFSIFGDLIEEFANIEEIVNKYNIKKSNIINVIKGIKNTELGCIWILKDDFSEQLLKDKIDVIKSNKPTFIRTTKRYYINNIYKYDLE